MRQLTKNMQYMTRFESARSATMLHITASRFMEEKPPCVIGIGLTMRVDGGRDEQLGVQAWPRECGSWGGAEWALFVACVGAHMRAKFTSALIQYKMQDRPTRGFGAELQRALETLGAREPSLAEWASGFSPSGPMAFLGPMRQMRAVMDRERGADFALQFDLRHFKRGRGFGLDVPDHSGRPATQYAVGIRNTFVRQASGRVFKSVSAFLAARIAEAARLPGYKEGNDAAFEAMLAALRGGPANAAAAEGVGGATEGCEGGVQ